MTLPEKVRDVTQSEWLEVRERLAAAESAAANDAALALTYWRQWCLAMAWGAEACTERDEAQRDWEREHERLAAREEQIEKAHAHTGCEREWTNLHDLGDCLTHAVADMAGALGVMERERNEVRAFLRRTAAGGSIVSSAAMTETQIAIARAAERMLVTPDGYGFVYVPGPSLQPGDESMEADLAAARAQLAQTEESLRLARNEILSGIDAEQLRVTREIQAARRDAERQRDVARSERDHAYDNADSIWAGVVGRLTKERDAARAQLAAVVEAAQSINHCISYSDTYQQWVLAYPDRTRPALDALRSAISDTAQAAREHDERVRAEERERCAKECEAYGRCAAERDATAAEKAADGLAAHIRALGSRP